MLHVRCVFVTAVVVALAARAYAAEPNTLSSVRVEATPDGRRILIEGSRAPTFTVFKVHNPTRVVVDLSNSSAAAVKSPLEVEDGLVEQVTTAQFNDAYSSIARVIVSLAHNVDYEVNGEGTNVVLTLRRAGGEGAIAAAPVEEVGALATRLVEVKYADVRHVRGLVEGDLSRNGEVTVDQAKKSLVVRDLPQVADAVAAKIKNLDEAARLAADDQARITELAKKKESIEKDVKDGEARAQQLASAEQKAAQDKEKLAREVQALADRRASEEQKAAAARAELERAEQEKQKHAAELTRVRAETESARKAADVEKAERQKELAQLSTKLEQTTKQVAAELAATQAQVATSSAQAAREAAKQGDAPKAQAKAPVKRTVAGAEMIVEDIADGAESPVVRVEEGGVVVRRRAQKGQAASVTGTLNQVKSWNTADHTIVELGVSGTLHDFEVLELSDPPRVAVDLFGVTRDTRLAHPVESDVVSQVRLGDHDLMTRVVIDVRGELPKYEATSTGSAVTLSFLYKEPARGGGNRIADVNFARKNGFARVKIPGAGAASFGVDAKAGSFTLTLRDVTLPEALQRTLDTTAYGTVVQQVSTYRDSKDGAVKVVVKTGGGADQKVFRRGDILYWDFRGTDGAPMLASGAERLPADSERAGGYETTAANLTREVAPQAESQKRRISLDLRDAEIGDVLRLISEVSDLNIIAGDDVKGKITMRLRKVPWDTALDIILRSKQLGMERRGNIIRVAPAAVLQKERETLVALKKTEDDLTETELRLIALSYTPVADLQGQVKKLLSSRGEVDIDSRTNSLIVKDVPDALTAVEDLVKALDTQTPQVLIESRIVEASSAFNHELGIQWGGGLNMNPLNGNPTGLGPLGILGLNGGAGSGGPTGSNQATPQSGINDTGGMAVNLPASVGDGSGGALGITLGSIGGSVLLNLRLSALEDEGTVKIVSAPKIVTLDNTKAEIRQGVKIPVATTSASGTDTKLIDAVLKLEVTPHVTQDRSILMHVDITKNEPDFSRTSAEGDPTIVERAARTDVLVSDGETTVIGGIYTRRNSSTSNGVPVLKDIPLIGWLFQKTRDVDDRAELLIFLTPRIVNRDSSQVRQ